MPTSASVPMSTRGDKDSRFLDGGMDSEPTQLQDFLTN